MFVLATTETHKVPATIVSRCQRFDFRRIPYQLTRDLLGTWLDQEMDVEPAVPSAWHWLRVADRDALGSLVHWRLRRRPTTWP
jgi:hypothetical protein